jgi:hypothetical protein
MRCARADAQSKNCDLFFESVPCGGDAYVLKHIIHDWDDENSLQILRNVRAAINPNGKVLIVEAVVPDDDREHLSKLLDLEMLVAAIGRERTESQYAKLLSQSGFRTPERSQLSGRHRSSKPSRCSRSAERADTPWVAMTHGVSD